MRNIKLTLEYDGTEFHGWQVQPGLRTVQGILEERFSLLLKEPIEVTGAGRTDGGVHALGQVANFKIDNEIPLSGLYEGGNSLLPEDVSIKKVEEVPLEFNARYSAKGKVYRYEISRVRSALRRRYAWEVEYPLNLERMKKGTRVFLGEHDFTSFSKNGDSESHITRIVRCEWHRGGDSIVFEVEGVRFLQNMVRIMVGTLVEVGRGRFSPDEVGEMLSLRDRRRAGPTAPPQGLFLVEVKY